MKREKILMSQKQLQRYRVMGLVEERQITLREAGEKIGVCHRQAKRIWQRVREKGVKGLIHGNTGRVAWNRISEAVREFVIQLSRDGYREFNDTHFTEKLREEKEVEISREAVRQLRRGAGILAKRKRRPPRHRKRRERKAQEGWMVLWDGSPHRWFGPDYPPCCLLVAMDDATGKVLVARFFPFEGSAGYLWLLRQVVDRYGIPVSIYQDRHGALHRNDDHWTLEEQLAGRQESTQVGQALGALGIQPIFALSPQAKGRIERLFGTLQDRLGAELRRAGVMTLEAAHSFLPAFMRAFNRRFSVSPQQAEKAWRKVPEGLDLNRVLSFRYPTTVGNDNAVRLGGIIIDIPAGPRGRSYAKAKVEVRQLLDGSWRVYFQNHMIAKHPSTTLQEPVRALPRKKPKPKGSNSYDWVYLSSAPKKANA
jgi:transposase